MKLLTFDRTQIRGFFQAFVIALPLIIFPFVIAELALDFRPPTVDRMLGKAIQNLIFFNTLHVIITFYVLLRYDGFRRALSHAIEGRQFRFYVISLFLLALGPVTYSLKFGGSSAVPVDGVLQSGLIFSSIYTCLALNHGVWQIRGIGLGYENGESAASVSWNKKLFYAFIGIMLVSRALLFLVRFDQQVQWQLSLAFAGGLVALLLLYQCWRSGKTIRFLFYLRLLLFPLVPFSTLAAFALPCFHGLEYVDYFQRLNKIGSFRKDVSPFRKVVIGSVVLLLGVIFTLPFIGLLRGDLDFDHSPVMIFIIGLNFGLGYLHYYLDEKIFAFANPRSREALRPFTSREGSANS